MKKSMICGTLMLAAMMSAPVAANARTGSDDQAVAERAQVRVWSIWARDRERAHRNWDRAQHRDFAEWRESQRQQFRAFHEEERTGARQDDDLDGYFIDDPNRYNAAPPPRSGVGRDR